MHDTTPSTAKVIRDTLLLGILLAGLNYVLAHDDPGWLSLNPTPWLLLPLLIGARYGVTSGILTGLLTGAAIIAVRSYLEGLDPWAFASQNRYPITCLAILGLLAGELNHLLRGDSHKLRSDLDRASSQVERLDAEIGLLRETRHELQRTLALHNAPLACLDNELKKVVSMPPDDTFAAILDVLHRLAGISSAAIYRQDGNQLLREAALHPTAPLKTSLVIDQTPLAARALEEKHIAAVTHPLESSAVQPFLAAVPWAFRQHSGVLLIQDMPLESLEWSNLARVEVVLHWALTLRTHLESMGSSGPVGRLVPVEDFMILLAQALETEKAHALPSSFIRFDPAPDSTALSADGRTLLAKLPPHTLTTRLPSGSFATLLPFVSDEAADHLATEVRHQFPGLRSSHSVISSPTTVEALWTSVLQS